MTKPKNLPIIGEVPCGNCGAPVPVQRCRGGKKVRIACTPCDVQTFMSMTTYQHKYQSTEDDPETESEAGTETGAGTPEPAGKSEPVRERKSKPREDDSASYFL